MVKTIQYPRRCGKTNTQINHVRKSIGLNPVWFDESAIITKATWDKLVTKPRG